MINWNCIVDYVKELNENNECDIELFRDKSLGIILRFTYGDYHQQFILNNLCNNNDDLKHCISYYINNFSKKVVKNGRK